MIVGLSQPNAVQGSVLFDPSTMNASNVLWQFTNKPSIGHIYDPQKVPSGQFYPLDLSFRIVTWMVPGVPFGTPIEGVPYNITIEEWEGYLLQQPAKPGGPLPTFNNFTPGMTDSNGSAQPVFGVLNEGNLGVMLTMGPENVPLPIIVTPPISATPAQLPAA